MQARNPRDGGGRDPRAPSWLLLARPTVQGEPASHGEARRGEAGEVTGLACHSAGSGFRQRIKFRGGVSQWAFIRARFRHCRPAKSAKCTRRQDPRPSPDGWWEWDLSYPEDRWGSMDKKLDWVNV
jgi:hypothetical protein